VIVAHARNVRLISNCGSILASLKMESGSGR
jgi:hypothetical protein